MATLGVQSITTAGVAFNYDNATATTGDRFLPADGTFIHLKNGSGVSVTVTLTTPATVDGLAVADRVITVGATTERFIAVPDSLYRDSDGLATVVCNPVTTVSLAVGRI